MPFSFPCKCSLGMSSGEAFKWPLQRLRWLWIYSQSMAAHKHRHSPFPHPKSEPHHRCPNPQRKVEETDTLFLFSRANLHQLQLPSEDLHLDTIFSSGVFFPSQTFQVKILSSWSRSSAKDPSDCRKLPVCQIDNSVAGGIPQRSVTSLDSKDPRCWWHALPSWI